MLKIIKSEMLTAAIDTHGAELKSVRDEKGNEFMWEANPDVWGNSAPIMFPICGGLKEDKYRYEGKEYTLSKHGFAKLSDFETESISENSVTMLLKSNAETKKKYPFDFEFRAVFSVEGSTLNIMYEVKNLSGGSMYFSLGGHEAYSTPEGIEEYDIVFDKKETLDAFALEGNILSYNKTNIITESEVLALNDDYFKVDALVFKEHNSNSCTLVHRNGTRRVKVEYSDFNQLLLWHKHLAKYICIEPWNGTADCSDANGNIEDKYAIIKLPEKESYRASHSITFSM